MHRVSRGGVLGHVYELCVRGGGGTRDHNFFCVASVAGNPTAPYKPAVTRRSHDDNLFLDMEATRLAEVCALPDLTGLILVVRLHLAGLSNNSLVTKLGIQLAVVRRGFQEDEFPLVYLCLLARNRCSSIPNIY